MPPTSSEEQTPHYTGFVRSGSQQAFGTLGTHATRAKRVGQYSVLMMRLAGTLMLALIACGAGYTLTQWLVPSHSLAANAADLAHGDAQFARPNERARDTEDVQADPNSRELPRAFSGATAFTRTSGAARNGFGHDPHGALGNPANAARGKAKRRSGDVAEVSVGASASDGLPVAGTAAELDMLSAESLRAELIAERVRALDEASEANTQAQLPELQAPQQALQAPPQVMAAAKTEERAPIVKPNPHPEQFERVPVLQLRAAANIEDLSVRGSLSASAVRRGVERLRPAFSSCYEHAARSAGHNRYGRIELGLSIDEAGRARAPQVQGPDALPGLNACLSSVASKLVSQPPDTGTVRATIVVNFTP